jgi:hypothetical protein
MGFGMGVKSNPRKEKTLINACMLSGAVYEEVQVRTSDEFGTYAFFVMVFWNSKQEVSMVVVCPDHLALTASHYLRKGDRVAVAGYLSRRFLKTGVGEQDWASDWILVAKALEPGRRDCQIAIEHRTPWE